MLEVRDIEAGYGSSQVLFGVTLSIRQGEVVTLLGRNGMGKTTTVRAIMGLNRISAGEISFNNQPLGRVAPYRAARAGIGLVPEGRQIFPTLNVRENLIATAANHRRAREPWSLQRIYQLFPRLAEREQHLGSNLSGGEQQMLAIGRALMTNPLLLILDEATEGLAPLIREEIWRCLELLKQQGESILIIDKNLDALMRISDRHYIMEKGRIVHQGDIQLLRDDPDLKYRYLGV
ncbi:ABC transporter ATP-binding protein [Aestuariirhabdus litorea]|uniref:ABC transporter ATP-binding protein n=1 Tax=Aestuariirhabdus litorea TaxID=2528527 RepID=A0A3P3VRA2_9GAMM|nr:ABC transporter ATP-binding protein [Aestuariirhabdus litorea]RRJ85321.1 ABC transporter ATP-binding protein [Aestuariirhabdus litorea]RWW98543.1 ATP-binding cassette domain-containing protein [Endozoicomonadaceae bacterium GTF-13]